jgi:ATP-dependent Clp protease ATP-binding subunit ClpC
MDRLLTTEDVANFLSVDVVTVRRLVAKGELPAYKIGGEYRFMQPEIVDYVKRQRIANGDPNRDMYDKFTDRARRVLAFSHEEAIRMQHAYIGTEHLLLGLVREEEGVAARVLRNMGVRDVEQVRSLVESYVSRGEKSPNGQLGMTGRAKKVVQLGAEEAKMLGHHFLGTEHLLLGLLNEGEGIGAKVLGRLGVDLKQARSQVLNVILSRGSTQV